MKLLITTEPDDFHAIAVKIALETLNYQVRLYFPADYPTQQTNSIFVENGAYRWKSSDVYQTFEDNEYDVVWWRRPRKPYLSHLKAHSNDRKFIARENLLFHESLTANIAPNAWWINPKEAARRSNYKLLQLKIASELGFIIPTTLCSNNPKEIADFLKTHEQNGVIYKPLCSNFWYENEKMKISYTNKVTLADLPQPELLQLTPGIYQPEIRKKYELRIVCFGNYLVAAKLNSQTQTETKIDWRAMRQNNLSVEPYKLLPQIEKRIRKFMSKLGIVFGSFDFIVTEKDEFISLEVNEQGQFLWLEDFNPEIKMLDIFVNFLVNQSENYTWDARKCNHSNEKYTVEINDIYNQNMKKHIYLNNIQERSQ